LVRDTMKRTCRSAIALALSFLTVLRASGGQETTRKFTTLISPNKRCNKGYFITRKRRPFGVFFASYELKKAYKTGIVYNECDRETGLPVRKRAKFRKTTIYRKNSRETTIRAIMKNDKNPL